VPCFLGKSLHLNDSLFTEPKSALHDNQKKFHNVARPRGMTNKQATKKAASRSSQPFENSEENRGYYKSTSRSVNNLLGERDNLRCCLGVNLLATLRLNLVLEGLKLVHARSNVALVE